MVDFTMKQTFPLTSIIDAAQRKAQLEQQAYQNGQEQLLQGLKSVGQVGQSLFEQKRKIAQSLALGRQLGLDDDSSRSMEPEQLIKLGEMQNKQIDMPVLAALLRGMQPNNSPALPSDGNETGATPAVDMHVTEVNPGTPSVQVPIQAPPAKPNKVNKATADLALKAVLANQQIPVVSADEALKLGSVKKGTIIRDTGREERHDENMATNLVNKFNSDPQIRRQQQALDGANTVRELVVSGNPIAAASIPTYMARASGEVGNLSEADKKPFGGTRAIMGRMQAAFEEMTTGRLSQSNRDFLLEMADIMEANANKNLDRHARTMAKQYSRTVKGLRDRDIFDSFRPGREFEEKSDVKANNSTVWHQGKEKRYQELMSKKKAGTLKR